APHRDPRRRARHTLGRRPREGVPQCASHRRRLLRPPGQAHARCEGAVTIATSMSTPIDAAPASALTHLECTRCGATYPADELLRLSPGCDKPLYPRYDLAAIRDSFTPAAVRQREPTLWRYADVLPVRDPAFRLTLGEGYTPLLEAPRLAEALDVAARLYVKDEGLNPTASFTARGRVMAVA